MKTIIGLAIGIVLAAAVIIPLTNARTEAELEAQRTQIALEQAQTELETLKTATQTAKSQASTPIETAKPREIKEGLNIETSAKAAETPETTKVEEGSDIEVTAEIESESAKTPPSSPQVKETPVPQAAYPKYFYENGQKYAYYSEFHEKEGMKTLITDESEPNATSGEVYDWLSDPLKDVKGPFDGNGGN